MQSKWLIKTHPGLFVKYGQEQKKIRFTPQGLSGMRSDLFLAQEVGE